MSEHFEPIRFTRCDRFLHALMPESRAWFSVVDLGSLTGCHLNERLLRKLDDDQHRVISLNHRDNLRPILMVSESGSRR